MDKKNAIWFSRHQPTQAQLDECAARGWNVVALDEGMRLGAINIMDDGDVHAVGTALLSLAEEHSAVAIIGVVAMKMKGGSDKPVEVRLEEVATRDLVSAVTASGKIEAKSQVDVSSEVTARILHITVKEGDVVTKGQLLVELDQVQFKGAVDRATASLTSVQAQLLQAWQRRRCRPAQSCPARSRHCRRVPL